MADFPTALDAALRAHYPRGGVKTPATQRRGLTARMNQLEKQFTHPGDRKGQATTRAAKATGISARTWQKWRAGTQAASPRLLAKLEAAYDKIIVEPGWKRRVNGVPAPDKVHISARIRWNGYVNKRHNGYRKVRFAGMRNTMRHTIRAWAREGPTEAAEVFERGVADVENVPNPPGIQFEGDDVIVEFPEES